MELKLNNPIAFFDLETTGINIVSDRIVEISILRVTPKGEEDVLTQRINPGIPIPEETTQIHGITDKDVADAEQGHLRRERCRASCQRYLDLG